jgi:predicted metal-binding protein
VRIIEKPTIKELTNIQHLEISADSLVFTTKCFCTIPYKNNKYGCPNYNKRPTCQPQAPYLESIKTEFKKFYLVYAEFDLKTYSDYIRFKHPTFTDDQTHNNRFYQNSVKKLLRIEIERVKDSNRSFKILGCGSGFYNDICSMEAVGINVFDTCKNNNIILDKNPKDKVVFVCLLYGNKPIYFNNERYKKLLEV